MKQILNTRIPSLCICFTLVILLNLLYTGFFHGGLSQAKGPLLLFLLCLLCQLVDEAVSRINFRKWLHYCIAESAVLYVVCLVFCAVFFWKGVSLRQAAAFSAFFFLIDSAVFFYFRKRQQLNVQEINALLRKRDASSPAAAPYPPAKPSGTP